MKHHSTDIANDYSRTLTYPTLDQQSGKFDHILGMTVMQRLGREISHTGCGRKYNLAFGRSLRNVIPARYSQIQQFTFGNGVTLKHAYANNRIMRARPHNTDQPLELLSEEAQK